MMITAAQTLPKVNVLSGDTLETFWNFLGSVFYMGVPVLLITVVLLLLPLIFDMILDAVKKARNGEEREEEEDWY